MPHTLDFILYDDISYNTYDATAVFYVSLSEFRNIFQFQTTEISNNYLDDYVFYDLSSNIQYYVNSSLFPIINPAHAMMDAPESEGIIFTSEIIYSNLLKHDYVYHIGKQLTGHTSGVALFTNIEQLKNNIEELGWQFKNSFTQKLINADNSGNGLTNNSLFFDNNNFSKRLLQQISYNDPDRLYTSIDNYDNKIVDTSGIQAVPLYEGDSINLFWTIKNNDSRVSDRKYRIRLQLVYDTNSIFNTYPTDSISNNPSYTHITSTGVPEYYEEYPEEEYPEEEYPEEEYPEEEFMN
jgi:hypothetical protein